MRLVFGKQRRLQYSAAMSFQELETIASKTLSRRIVRAAGVSALLLAAAAGLMWARYGSLIFVDMLSVVQSCF